MSRAFSATSYSMFSAGNQKYSSVLRRNHQAFAAASSRQFVRVVLVVKIDADRETEDVDQAVKQLANLDDGRPS
jgi:hypothetical protein